MCRQGEGTKRGQGSSLFQAHGGLGEGSVGAKHVHGQRRRGEERMGVYSPRNMRSNSRRVSGSITIVTIARRRARAPREIRRISAMTCTWPPLSHAGTGTSRGRVAGARATRARTRRPNSAASSAASWRAFAEPIWPRGAEDRASRARSRRVGDGDISRPQPSRTYGGDATATHPARVKL